MIKWRRYWFISYLYQAPQGGINYGYKTITTDNLFVKRKSIVDDCLRNTSQNLGVDKDLIAVTAFNRI